MEELRILYHKYGIRGFYFADDIITSPRKLDQDRFIDLCRLIKAEFPDVVFRATTRADTLSEELCKAMAEAGSQVDLSRHRIWFRHRPESDEQIYVCERNRRKA